MDIIEIKNDILSADRMGYMLCHCVALDCVMEDGISYKLCKAYQHSWGIAYHCRRYVRTKNTGALGTAFKPTGFPIYSLFVKKKHYDKYNDTYGRYLKQALNDMKTHMIQTDKNLLAMPKLGCGRDRGNWIEIKNMIEVIYKNTDIKIIVYI